MQFASPGNNSHQLVNQEIIATSPPASKSPVTRLMLTPPEKKRSTKRPESLSPSTHNAYKRKKRHADKRNCGYRTDILSRPFCFCVALLKTFLGKGGSNFDGPKGISKDKVAFSLRLFHEKSSRKSCSLLTKLLQ